MKLLKYLVMPLAFGLALQAKATDIQLSPSDAWHEFSVDDYTSQSRGAEWIDTNDSNSPEFGSPLHYLFDIPVGFTGFLSVVDAGFAGDRFEIFNHGLSLGRTTATWNNSDYSNDFSVNWNNANFSRAFFMLDSGSYDITGNLFSSLQSFNATNGALMLQVVGETKLPEPDAALLLCLGFGLIALARLRKPSI